MDQQHHHLLVDQSEDQLDEIHNADQGFVRVSDPEKAQKENNLNGRFTKYLFFCLIFASIGSAFQFGWNIGIYNTPEDVIKDFYNKTYFNRNGVDMPDTTFTTLWSITNGLMPAGGLIGGLSSGFFADLFGRKKALMYTNVLVVISAILNIASKFIPAYETLMAGRFFAGVLSGLFSGILPLYLNELAPANLRGFTGTMNQLSIVAGIVVTNIFGLPQILGSQTLWPVLVGFMLVPALAHFALLLAVESPKHL